MSSQSLRLLIVGGHGKVAQHLTRHALAHGHTVLPVIRNAAHESDLPRPSSGGQGKLEPIVASLEDSSVAQLSKLFQQHAPNVVVFAAGAGGKGGPERTRAVDFEGAVKVFDAIEDAQLAKKDDFKRCLLVSAIDSRDTNKAPPEWYEEKDIERSKATRDAIGFYSQMKYEADKNLSERKTFPWFVLRPGGLTDEPGSGKVALGERKTITTPVRDEPDRLTVGLMKH